MTFRDILRSILQIGYGRIFEVYLRIWLYADSYQKSLNAWRESLLLIDLSLWTAKLPIFWMVRILGKRQGAGG